MLFRVQIILAQQEKWVKLGKSNSVKSHWIFASCASYALIQSILYRSRSVRRYTPECPSNAPESPYYGNRLPIRFRDTRLYVLFGPCKHVMIERRRNVRKNFYRSYRRECAFDRRSSVALHIYSLLFHGDMSMFARVLFALTQVLMRKLQLLWFNFSIYLITSESTKTYKNFINNLTKLQRIENR